MNMQTPMPPTAARRVQLARLFSAFDRDAVETAVELLLGVPDAADGDPDIEPNGDERDTGVTGWNNDPASRLPEHRDAAAALAVMEDSEDGDSDEDGDPREDDDPGDYARLEGIQQDRHSSSGSEDDEDVGDAADGAYAEHHTRGRHKLAAGDSEPFDRLGEDGEDDDEAEEDGEDQCGADDDNLRPRLLPAIGFDAGYGSSDDGAEKTLGARPLIDQRQGWKDIEAGGWNCGGIDDGEGGNWLEKVNQRQIGRHISHDDAEDDDSDAGHDDREPEHDGLDETHNYPPPTTCRQGTPGSLACVGFHPMGELIASDSFEMSIVTTLQH